MQDSNRSVVHLVVFSKDRPFQLKEFLRTFYQCITLSGDSLSPSKDNSCTPAQVEISILYTYSTEKLGGAYNLVEETFEHVNFVKETDFSVDLETLVGATDSRYIMFAVDDALFYDTFDLSVAFDFLCPSSSTTQPFAFAFHFKLHPNITFSHAASQSCLPLPPFAFADAEKQALQFVPTKGKSDWNYPWELCASIYTKETVENMLKDIVEEHGRKGISHPNYLESSGNSIIQKRTKTNSNCIKCACPNRPILSVLTINRVQDIYANPVYDSEIGVEQHSNGESNELEQLVTYLEDGSEFDLEHYRKFRYSSVHIGDVSFAKTSRSVEETCAELPLVSVVIPVYNDSVEHCDAAIRSILSQTYSNIELIIVNDGSTCNFTNEMLQNVAKNHPERVVLLQNEVNRGVAASLNKGISACRGDFIARMDADDISLPDRIERQVSFLLANEDVHVLGTGIEIFNVDTDLQRVVVYPTSVMYTHWCMFFGSFIAHPSLLIRRSAMSMAGGYNETIEHAEDYDLWHRIIVHCGLHIKSLGEVLFRHRKHGRNTSVLHREKQTNSTVAVATQSLTAILGTEIDMQCVCALHGDIGAVPVETLKAAIDLVRRLETYFVSSEVSCREWTDHRSSIAVREDAARRTGELAFYSLQKNPLVGVVAWQEWVQRNPSASRSAFMKLVS